MNEDKKLEARYSEISDHRLQGMLKQYIYHYAFDKATPEQKRKLRGILFCGSSIAGHHKHENKTFLIVNDKKSKLTRLAHCYSIWSCPHCTPIIMAKRGERIGAAIDALSTIHKQSACMITLTLPHTKDMSLHDTYTILLNTWRRFNRCGKRKQVARDYTYKTDKVGKKGTVASYNHKQSISAQFRFDLKIQHTVRVYEITYGENSWHPHIHALLWVPNSLFNKIANYESKLLDFWWYCAYKETLKYYNQKYPENKAENQIKADDLFAEWRKYPKTGHRSLYISKNPDGSIKKQSSAMYLSGWSGNMELTASTMKDGRNGHVTPFQILENAYKALYYQNDHNKFQELMKLYTEYLIETRVHRRIECSKTGLNKIINEWLNSDEYIREQKKRFMEKETVNGRWKTICYFTGEQLFEISHHSLSGIGAEEGDLMSTIHELATTFELPLEKRRQKIKDLLEDFGIYMRQEQFTEPEKYQNFMPTKLIDKNDTYAA